MYKKLYLLFAGLSLMAINATAQKTRTITGEVLEINTKKPLPFTSIQLINTTIGVSADINGKFKLKIPLKIKSPKLVAFYVGYEADTVTISASKSYYTVYLTSEEHNLKAVVISGTSEKVEIRKNSAPIVAITPKQIETTSATNVIDALAKHTPGFTTLKTGPNVSKPFIHGLGFNRVLSLYDGIRMSGQQWGDEHGVEVDDYNVKQAKIVEGPASLKYGSDAIAGVMSLIPYSPNDTDKTLHGEFLSEYQSNNGLYGNHLRLEYGGKHWGYGLSGSYRIARNFQNPIDGKVYNTGFNQKNFAATIRYQNKKGHSKLAFNFYDDRQGIPDGSRDSLTRKFTKQIYEEDSDDIYNRPIVSQKELNSYDLSPLHQKIQNYRLYNKNHYKIGKGNINVDWALQHNSHIEYAHPTEPQVPGEDFLLNTLNYGAQYDAPTFSNISLGAGINGMYQENKSSNGTEFPIPNYKSLSLGGFLFGNWKYQLWSVNMGIRYDMRNLKNNDNFYVGNDAETGFDKEVYPPDTSGAILKYTPFNYNFGGVTMSLGTTYEISEHLSVKANVARGYRAPNISELAANGLDIGSHIRFKGNKNFKPEFSLQQSLGLNISYNSVSGMLSFFNNNISNFIYSGQIADTSGNPIIDAQGNRLFGFRQSEAQVYGFDASLSVRPMHWHGFSFDNTLATTYGFNRASQYVGKGVDGEYLPQIPPLMWISSLRQIIHVKSHFIHSIAIHLGSEYDAAQNRYLALNGTETYTPSYVLFNAALNFQIRYHKQKSLHLKLGVNNLLNTAYQSGMSRLKYFEYYTASPTGHLGIYNMGRNYTVKLILPF